MLSKRALELLQVLFSEQSNLQVPIGLVKEVIEIREWVKEELKSNQNLTIQDKPTDNKN